jgi:DNA-binding MarR family transcriptional regulator
MSCSCFAVRRAARLITQHYERHLKPAGLRATQFTLLTVLAIAGPLPLSRIAHRLGTERTTLTRNLRPLIARGYVAVERGADRRVQILAITPQGITATRAALPRWREAQDSIAGFLSPGALRALDHAARASALQPPIGPNAAK